MTAAAVSSQLVSMPKTNAITTSVRCAVGLVEFGPEDEGVFVRALVVVLTHPYRRKPEAKIQFLRSRIGDSYFQRGTVNALFFGHGPGVVHERGRHAASFVAGQRADGIDVQLVHHKHDAQIANDLLV